MSFDTNYPSAGFFSELDHLVRHMFSDWDLLESESASPGSLEEVAKTEDSRRSHMGRTSYSAPKDTAMAGMHYNPAEDEVMDITLTALGDGWKENDEDLDRFLDRGDYLEAGEDAVDVAQIKVPRDYEKRDLVKSVEALKEIAENITTYEILDDPSQVDPAHLEEYV